MSAVQSWRRIAIIGVLAFMAGVAAWAYLPWSDVVTLDVPKGAPPRSVSYSCGRLVGSSDVKPSEDAVTAAYPLAHKPCGARTERRVLAVLDGAVGVVGVVVLVALLTRFSTRQPEAAPAG